MSKAPIETWAFWAPLVLAIVCLLTGVTLHRFAFPTLEKNLFVLSRRLHDYPLLVLIMEETVAHTLIPSLSRFILLGCIYGRAMGGFISPDRVRFILGTPLCTQTHHSS